MRTWKCLAWVLLLWGLSGCCTVKTYPGGVTKEEWDSLPPDQRAEIRAAQLRIDEERRENNERDSAQREVLAKRSDVERESPRARDDMDDAIPGWAFLGQVEAAFHRDHDAVEPGISRGKFHELKFIVRRGDLDIYNMTVFIGDADALSPVVRGHYEKNTSCRIIQLPGGERTVRRIDFDYCSTDRRDGKALVYVYAR